MAGVVSCSIVIAHGSPDVNWAELATRRDAPEVHGLISVSEESWPQAQGSGPMRAVVSIEADNADSIRWYAHEILRLREGQSAWRDMERRWGGRRRRWPSGPAARSVAWRRSWSVRRRDPQPPPGAGAASSPLATSAAAASVEAVSRPCTTSPHARQPKATRVAIVRTWFQASQRDSLKSRRTAARSAI